MKTGNSTFARNWFKNDKLNQFIKTSNFLISLRIFSLFVIVVNIILILRTVIINPYWLFSTDFGVYVIAGSAIFKGANPYDFKYYFYTDSVIRDQYPYPPLLAEFMIPQIAIGEAVRYLWLLICFAFLLGSLIILFKDFGFRASWTSILVTLALILSTNIVRNDLYHGQVNFMILFLIVYGLKLQTKNSPILAGIFLGLSFLIKPFLGLIFIYLLWRGFWKTALSSFLTCSIIFVLSFIPLFLSTGFSAFNGWLDVSTYYSAAPKAAREDNLSIHGLILRLFTPSPFSHVWVDSAIIGQATHFILLALVITAIFFALPFRKYASISTKEIAIDPPTLLVEVGLVITLGMAYGPVAEGDHFIILLFCLVGVILLAIRRQNELAPTRKAWTIAACLYSFFFFLQASPIRVQLLTYLKFTDWNQPDGPSILVTGLTGFLLLIVGLAIAYALYIDRKRLIFSKQAPGSTKELAS